MSRFTSNLVSRVRPGHREPGNLGFLLLVVVAIWGAAFMFGTRSLVDIATLSLIQMAIVIGLYMYIGESGVFSFGHIAFVAIGAYVAGILCIPEATKAVIYPDMPGFLSNTSTPWYVALLAGGAAAGILALVVGLMTFRSPPMNAALATFALLLGLNVVLEQWSAVTNGTGGITNIETIDPWLALAVVAIVITVVWFISGTRQSRMLRASREDVFAARAIGINVERLRLRSFVSSAVVCGLAGALFAQTQGTISPSLFFLPLTLLTLAMLVIGGQSSLTGAILGSVVVTVWSEFLARGESGDLFPFELPASSTQLGIGLLLLLVLIFRPDGLTRGWEFLIGRRRRGSDDGLPPMQTATPVSREPVPDGGGERPD